MSRRCNKCGSMLEDDALFCNICGADLNSQQNGQINYQINNPEPPKKKNKGLMIALALFGIMSVFAIVVIIIILVPLFKPHGVRTESEINSSVTSEKSEISKESSENKESSIIPESYEAKESSVEESKLEESSREEESSVESSLVESSAESSVIEQSSKNEASDSEKLPYEDRIGKIAPNDFAWIADAMSGNMEGKFLSNDELVGKWKTEIIYDGVWELAYITIDRQANVTIQPYEINYGDGWEDESGEEPLYFKGSFDINRVYGSGEYAKIDLYQFLESHDYQYAVGEISEIQGSTQSETVKIYMVRP